MNFPISELKTIYLFITGKSVWSKAVFDALIAVIQYGYELFDKKELVGSKDVSIESALQQVIDSYDDNAVGFAPGLWVVIISASMKILMNQLGK